MDRVNRQTDKSINQIRCAAVVIGEPRVVGQRHTGILFRVDSRSSIEFLHLAYHHLLIRRPGLKELYCWVDPNIPLPRLRQLAAICDDIAHANENEKIPYSFGAPSDAFDRKTKKFLIGPTHTGLTCASFVLAVFEVACLRLVKYSGWPNPSADDVNWQQSVLDGLRANPHVSPEHIQTVEREVGSSVRYRPEQVAAAAAIRARRPISYKHAQALGENIVQFIRGEAVDSPFRFPWWERLLRSLRWPVNE